MSEEWRPVDGFDRYECSSLGRIRSLGTGRVLSGKARKDNGYVAVGLWTDDGSRTMRVHAIIARAFIPNPDAKPQVNHKDGDRANNAVANLEWVTPKENRQHAKARGTSSAVNNPNFRFKLSLPDVSTIKARLATGEMPTRIAEDFGVQLCHVVRIRDGKAWAGAPTGDVALAAAAHWKRELRELCEFIQMRPSEPMLRLRVERLLDEMDTTRFEPSIASQEDRTKQDERT